MNRFTTALLIAIALPLAAAAGCGNENKTNQVTKPTPTAAPTAVTNATEPTKLRGTPPADLSAPAEAIAQALAVRDWNKLSTYLPEGSAVRIELSDMACIENCTNTVSTAKGVDALEQALGGKRVPYATPQQGCHDGCCEMGAPPPMADEVAVNLEKLCFRPSSGDWNAPGQWQLVSMNAALTDPEMAGE